MLGDIWQAMLTMRASGRMYKWEFVEEGRSKNGEEEKRKGEERKEREERKRKRMRRKGERKREKRKSAFRRSELIEPRSKGCIFDEGYAQRGKNSSYFGLLLLG